MLPSARANNDLYTTIPPRPWTQRLKIEYILEARVHEALFGKRGNPDGELVPDFLSVSGNHALEEHDLWMKPFSFKFRRVELLYDAEEEQYYTKYSVVKTLEYV